MDSMVSAGGAGRAIGSRLNRRMPTGIRMNLLYDFRGEKILGTPFIENKAPDVKPLKHRPGWLRRTPRPKPLEMT